MSYAPATPVTRHNAAAMLAYALHCLETAQHIPGEDSRRTHLEMDAECEVRGVFGYLDANKDKLP